MGIKDLLKNLADGKYDGERIDNESGGVEWGFYIKKGTPVQYRYGKKSPKFFDGKENIRIPRTVDRVPFDTREKKISFFRQYGFLREMFENHPEVITYSRKYKKKS